MRGVEADIREIGNLIESARTLMAVREEVAKARCGFVVTDGKHQAGGEGYDVVVRCAAEVQTEVARRIRSGVSDVKVEDIAEGVLGVRMARRGRRIHGI
jgi:hypothetical protein